MTSAVSIVTTFLSVLTVVGDVFIVAVIFSFFYKENVLARFLKENALLLSFLVALSGTVSSLFYSEIAGFLPCTLCWWQRIFLYPQAIILGLALKKHDWSVKRYVISLSTLGALIALYHTYLQFGGIPLAPCSASVASCTQRFFLEFGYVTIPTMSLTGFLLILTMMLISKSENAGVLHKAYQQK